MWQQTIKIVGLINYPEKDTDENTLNVNMLKCALQFFWTGFHRDDSLQSIDILRNIDISRNPTSRFVETVNRTRVSIGTDQCNALRVTCCQRKKKR